MDPKEIKNQSSVQVPPMAGTEDESDEIDKLFQAVMKNKWGEVVATYKNSPRARKARLISKSEDTALHIAVMNEQTKHALNLVDTIDEDVLVQIRNAKGNTPLHLAAMLGNRIICEKMVLKSPKLMAVRNNDGETPIFMAAHHGQAHIFFYLHENFGKEEEYVRRNNGDTILHVAISGEYFSMAMKIIDKHQNLVDAMNVDGLTPLHVLANKPNAFKTSTGLGTFDRLIYYCLYVDIGITDAVYHDKTKIEKYRKHIGGKDHSDIGNYPKNYKTCMNSIDFLLKKLCLGLIVYLVPARVRIWIAHQWDKLHKQLGNPDDEENLQQRSDSEQSAGYGPTGGASPTTITSNQRQDDAQAVPTSSTSSPPATGNENIENTTRKKEQSALGSCFSQYCVEEVLIEENRKRLYPPNYDSFELFLKVIIKILLIILGVGIWGINEIQRKKELHVRAKLVMEKLVNNTKFYKSYGNTGSIPDRYGRQEQIIAEAFKLSVLEDHKAQEDPDFDPPKAAEKIEKLKKSQWRRKKQSGKKKAGKGKRGKAQTPILIAAKNGVTEMVEKILDEFPVAIGDEDAEQKNVVLLAVENRQPHVYKFLLKKENIPRESVFRHVDCRGNSALHLAATQCEEYRPWLIPGSALQMQWEIKWFKFVKASFPPNFFHQYNKSNQTPNEVFANTHKDLIKDGSDWLTKTSQSCSVVAALVATVAFATSATVPGGINEENGTPTLEKEPAFNAFAISSLAALCFSITALIFFLSILTSRYREKDFALDLPRKLLFGLTSLFVSIVSMLVSFCAGHIFVLNNQFRYVAYPLYAALCLPITFFAFAQLSLYFDLLVSIFRKVPQRSYEVLAH